jgi:MFS superfamily sulfate permease-like transporter
LLLLSLLTHTSQQVLHNVVALILMILALTTITHQLFYLPKAILAAVIINALGPMLEFKNGLKYYKLNKGEFFIWLATFVVCLFGGMSSHTATIACCQCSTLNLTSACCLIDA